MTEQDVDALLEEILDAIESGVAIDEAALIARYPDRAPTVRLLLAAREEQRRIRHADARASVEHERLAPGARLGDFEIEEWVARGGMGDVYRGRQLSLGNRLVAIKVHSAALASDTARRRFEREALLAAELHHENLAEVYGFGEERGLVFLAMRFVRGPTLADVLRVLGDDPELRNQRETCRSIVSWMAQVSQALALVHDANLVHRDIKPANIMIDQRSSAGSPLPAGRAVLIDFGLVRGVERSAQTLPSEIAATPAYAAPEQVVGREVDARGDVFSLGATLHDLLTGRLPSTRAPASAGLPRLHSVVPNVDADLDAIVAKACEPDVLWRYANGSEMAEDLDAWLTGRPVRARSQSMRERVQRWLRANPVRVARWIGLAVCVFAAALAFDRHVQTRDRVAAARAAFECGDVDGLVVAANGLGGLWRLYVRDVALARAVERARLPADESPYTPIASRLRVEDFAGAMLAAVTHVRVCGFDDDALITRHIERELVLDDLATNAGSSGRVSLALAITARLFFERPILNASDAHAAAGIDFALVTLWTHESLSWNDRLRVLAAFSGSSPPDDALWIVAWALEHSEASEERRLGVLCAQRIVQRSIVAWRAGELAFDALWHMIEPTARAAFVSIVAESECWPLNGAPLRNLLVTLGLAERVATGRCMRMAALPDAWQGEQVFETVCGSIAAETASALGNSSWLDWLPSQAVVQSSATSHCVGGGALAWSAVISRGLDYASGWRERLRTRSGLALDEDVLEAFDSGTAAAVENLSGMEKNWLPDADTLLSGDADEEFCALPVIRKVDRATASHSALAAWEFSTQPFQIEGTALSLAARACNVGTSERGAPYLRMGRFGASALRLDFDVPSGWSSAPSQLLLRHRAATRGYMPFEGEVYLEISLDGKLLAGALPIYPRKSDAPLDDVIDIPVVLLRAGRHRLELRNLIWTNTTYRLYRVELRRG